MISPDRWLEQYYDGEYFTGRFDHLKHIVSTLGLIPKCKIITVAGTNGKGETSRILNHILVKNELKTGLWTSPHLFKVNERFQFNEQDISDQELIHTFQSLKDKIESHNFKLSYFEFLFVSFLCLVKERNLEYLILEVGLGGRLDAVNVLDANICLLTSIARDHQDILGNRYSQILMEKLGILRSECHFYSSIELDYLQKIIKTETEKKNIQWYDLFQDGSVVKSDHFSKRNSILAQTVAKNILGNNLNLDLSELSEYSCRFKSIRHGALCELYPSHNVDGLRKLVQFLGEAKYNNYDLVLIALSERLMSDLRVMMTIMKQHFSNTKIVLFEFDHMKAIKTDKLKIIRDEFNLDVTNKSNLKELIEEFQFQKILVTGSNYFLGDFAKS